MNAGDDPTRTRDPRPDSILATPTVDDPSSVDASAAAVGGLGPTVDKTTAFIPLSDGGTLIAGKYTLVEQISEGGMGEVWVSGRASPSNIKLSSN